jgi:hypothetical protein
MLDILLEVASSVIDVATAVLIGIFLFLFVYRDKRLEAAIINKHKDDQQQ